MKASALRQALRSLRWRTAMVVGVVLVFAIQLAALIIHQSTANYRVVSSSMMPAVLPGDVVLANRRAYAPPSTRQSPTAQRQAMPQRGDVIVFRNPIDARIYVKRVIGLPGESVAMADGAAVINGVRAELVDIGRYRGENEAGRPVDVIVREEIFPDGVVVRVHHFEFGPGSTAGVDDRAPTQIPPGHYFVMGDNRDLSYDSRWPQLVGLVRVADIIGRVDRIAMSTTPAFAAAKPSTWLEFRGERFWAPVHRTQHAHPARQDTEIAAPFTTSTAPTDGAPT